LQTPLPISRNKIKKGGLRRLGIVEPLWTYPNNYNADDPLRSDFYVPQSWFVQGKLVHASRLLTFIGRDLPDILKPAYVFGGLSLSQMLMPYVDNWLRTRQSVSDLIYNFSTMVLSTNLAAAMQPGGLGNNAGDELLSRVTAFNLFRSNRGLMVVDKDTEGLDNVAVPLGTLDHLQAQSQEQMASVQGIPLTVLLGITPTGLNATTDGEIRVFYDWIHAQQEDMFADHLKAVMNIIQLSEFGDIDEDIEAEFLPLWELDAAGLAAVMKTNADTDIGYIDAGVLRPEEVRQTLASDDDAARYTGIKLSDPPPEPPEETGEADLSDPSEQIDKQAEEGATSGANSGV
jgi:phage-related protein (TIGR01555 family)